MNNFWKTILIQILFTFITCYTIKYYVERHSVHPIYSVKNVNLEKKCYPWDSCES